MSPSEVVNQEIEGVKQNIDILGTPKFYQFKKHSALRYWKGQFDAMMRLRHLFQVEELKKIEEVAE
ncbi:hypothetical protein [Enterococcus diestrammenae]|uniref:hypothetical protein n=1 Tax=Enterococcus diestrammenae TaxID=1155073 RepID=UPI0019573E61